MACIAGDCSEYSQAIPPGIVTYMIEKNAPERVRFLSESRNAADQSCCQLYFYSVAMDR